MKTLKKHPAAVELDNWIESAEGKGCTEPTTLNAPAMQQRYLKNRLKRAFMDGWCAAEKHGYALRVPAEYVESYQKGNDE
jgi:hypothetical protein